MSQLGQTRLLGHAGKMSGFRTTAESDYRRRPHGGGLPPKPVRRRAGRPHMSPELGNLIIGVLPIVSINPSRMSIRVTCSGASGQRDGSGTEAAYLRCAARGAGRPTGKMHHQPPAFTAKRHPAWRDGGACQKPDAATERDGGGSGVRISIRRPVARRGSRGSSHSRSDAPWRHADGWEERILASVGFWERLRGGEDLERGFGAKAQEVGGEVE